MSNLLFEKAVFITGVQSELTWVSLCLCVSVVNTPEMLL
jgi:hypothetical protein